jgi:hypothetical protein
MMNLFSEMSFKALASRDFANGMSFANALRLVNSCGKEPGL